MAVGHINYSDTLRQGTDKINAAIDQSNEAITTANDAKSTADQALVNSENTQTQLDTIVINGDSSVEAAQARVAANGTTFTTLKARLDDSDARLADNAASLSAISYKNAQVKLNLISAYGDNEAYHPKVVMFDTAWNGYKYWMAFTPYPNADQSKENPHILASNDMINWVKPTGLTNPINTPAGSDPSKQYNSDTHLLYNPDLNRLELFWRYVDDVADKVYIYRKTSTDGVTFSTTDTFISATRSVQDFVSPAIIYENGVYKMWFVANWSIWYTESSDGGSTWSTYRNLNITYEDNVYGWHIDCIHTDVGYELFIVATPDKNNRQIMPLYYSVSNDNITYSMATKILTPSKQEFTWDNKGIYRTGVTKFNGIYYVFYSGISKEGKYGIGLTFGADLKHLKGMERHTLPTKIAARRSSTITADPNQDYRVSFDTVTIDINRELSSSTFIAKESGLYLITAYITFAAQVPNNAYLRLYENGTYKQPIGGGTGQQVLNFSRLVYLQSGFSYDFYIQQTSAGSVTVNTVNIEIAKV